MNIVKKFIQSILPEQYEEETIGKDLGNREIAYTVPWAMFADRNRALWINGAYSFTVSPCGTSSMKIRRHGSAIQVDASTLGDFRYTPGDPCYVGQNENDFIPVELVDRM